uniref:Centriolar coiled-coil protein of 110 kDa-like n=1 Tax=Knipowitschia caucasica TaxID=637954 RepID=A0AAV2LR90_KNICA
MEDYEKFVELRLSQLKMTEDTVEDKPKVPSLICFYGRPILPPLVSEAQKKEMTRLKEAAQTAAANRNHKDDPRMSYVQTILRSVDIRKTPTLEELLKESEIDNQSLPDVGHDSSCTSLNQSYDVDTPSELWLNCLFEEKHMTPESGGEGQRSKVKRRLQMTEGIPAKEDEQAERRASTSKAAAQWHEGLDGVKERQAQLRQIHAAQIRALQDQHQRQQEQLLQALAVRYSLLQSVSLPCSVSTSRLGDTLTFPTLSQLPLPVHYRHLLSAIAKGFLTRRLLKTERVAQLVRTARDTHQFLQAFQKHSPNKGLPSRQDLFLQERVTLQLRAARYEIHDIFFSLSPREKMQLISIDRDLARERAFKQQNAHGGKQRGKGTLSAATQKSLERKSAVMMYKKSAERHRGAGTRLRHKPGLSAEQSLETRAGQHRANPQRVPKSTYTSRPR